MKKSHILREDEKHRSDLECKNGLYEKGKNVIQHVYSFDLLKLKKKSGMVKNE
jgi:hypothetical protein